MKLPCMISLLLIIANVALAQTNQLPDKITIDGVTYENVRWGKPSLQSVEVIHKSGVASIPLSKLPEELQVKFGYDPQKVSQSIAAERAGQVERQKIAEKTAEVAKRKAEEDRMAEATRRAKQTEEETKNTLAARYADAMAFIQMAGSNLDSCKGDDRSVMKALIQTAEEFTAAYKTGDIQKAEVALKKMDEALNTVHETKPVYGYRYNEFLHDEVTVPVIFNMYSNNTGFYLQVGDGDFSTISPLEIKTIEDLAAGLQKSIEWTGQCIKQKLNTRKEVGNWGSISLEFVSEENGQHCYTWLKAKGPFGRDRLIEESTVKLTMLNVQCLLTRISHADKIVEKRIRVEGDSQKLK